MNTFSAVRQIQRPQTTNSASVQLAGSTQKADESMFEKHFQLQRRPFASVPNPEYYYSAATIENARESLVRLIERDSGPALVVGPVGIGKTLLSQLLLESFRHRCRVVRLPNARLFSRRALLQVVLHELGLPFRDLDEGEARLALIDHVTNLDVCPEGVLLLVDEAEGLSMAVLDELRTMTNLTSENRACIRLVLFGNRRLEEKFAHPRLESFNQRLAGRFYLESFTRDEIEDYIRQQIQESGGDAETIFAEDAFSTIAQATGGIPRLINQLCGHALILATINNIDQLDGQCIAEAWADLQQLPVPTPPEINPVDADTARDIVEFGQLDELPDEDPIDDEAADFESQTETTLSEIEENLALTNSETESTFQTEVELIDRPEIELVFHDAHTTADPFDEAFDEEEIVIDDYLRPSILADQHRIVTCDESDDIADQLHEVLNQVSRVARDSSESVERFGNHDSDLARENELDIVASVGHTPSVHDTGAAQEPDDRGSTSGDVEIHIDADSEEADAEQSAQNIEHVRPAHEECPSEAAEPSIAFLAADSQEQPVPPEESDVAKSESAAGDKNGEDSAPAKTDRDIYRNLFTRLRHTHG